jgi:SET domain-containing protein
MDVVVAPSRIAGAGQGLFAAARIEAGTVVCFYTGDVLRTVDALRLADKAYLMRLGPQTYIDAGDAERHGDVMARYINDSRNPARHNVRFDKRPDELRAAVIATRDIEAGEELYVDYGRWCDARKLL